MKQSLLFGVASVTTFLIGLFLWFIGVSYGYTEIVGNKTVAVDGIAYPYRIYAIALFILTVILIIIAVVKRKK